MDYNYSDYYIAVLGYPRSGKSIFITSFLNNLLHSKRPDYEIINIEKKTRQKLKDNLKCLSSQMPFEREKTESVFPYMVKLSREKLMSKKYLNVHIGDFSDDSSAQFHNGYRQWFHKSQSYVWALQANAFVFVVDLAEVLAQYEDDYYCEKISNAIHEAWKRAEKSSLGINEFKNKPIVLLFTKADLLLTFYKLLNTISYDQMKIKMFQMGFSKKLLPPTTKIEKNLDPYLFTIIEEKFKGIIHYLNRKSKRYNTVFFSHFLIFNGKPMGIESVIDSVLPK